MVVGQVFLRVLSGSVTNGPYSGWAAGPVEAAETVVLPPQGTTTLTEDGGHLTFKI